MSQKLKQTYLCIHHVDITFTLSPLPLCFLHLQPHRTTISLRPVTLHRQTCNIQSMSVW